MTYSHLLSLLEEAKMSPEQLGKRLGISGMTVRRWRDEPPSKDLPKLYEKALVDLIQELVAEGKLSSDSSLAKAIIAENAAWPAASSGQSLGITEKMLEE